MCERVHNTLINDIKYKLSYTIHFASGSREDFRLLFTLTLILRFFSLFFNFFLDNYFFLCYNFNKLKSSLMFGFMKGFDLMDIKVSDLLDCLSKDDISFLWDLVLEKYKSREHYLFDCFFGSDDSGADVIPDDYVNELNDILYDFYHKSIDLSSSGRALDIINKLNSLIDKYCIREGEAAEYENEMIDLPAVKHDFVPKYSYLITIFYSDGKSFSSQLSRSSNGLVLNLQQNKLELDSPERGTRFYFNLFNLYEPEKIVAIDIHLQPVEDLPF